MPKILLLVALRIRPMALATMPFRTVHNDVQFPNFDAYRNKLTKDPAQPSHVTQDDRRGVNNFIYYGVGGALTLMAAKFGIQKVVHYKWMPRDQAALAATEIDLTLTFEWRGKPVFVKHRTDKEIARERAVDVSKLRHAQRDEDRVQKPEWSILLGVCTHLGCIPLSNKGDFGGYFCPCHGSHYDASGRIRKGPAPLNLEVPKYEFVSDTLVKVG
uniref:Cytochrome b-c1 complex subunit Rieske, mitochondrial n=1 Tax=Globodera pallida TaxID=36090 RepID=A0A183CI98_GLOPA